MGWPCTMIARKKSIQSSRCCLPVTAQIVLTERSLLPVFAAVFGSLMLHQEFGASTAVGGALAISAVLIRCAEPDQLKAAWKDTADTIKARLKPQNP